MKFVIFHELSVAKPWHERSEYEVYHNALEQVELADELGFDQAWAVEHHFLEEYSHCSAPEVFLAAAAARTKRIRLGHGIAVVLPPFNHPVRCAERAAALDIISNGRLEFGTGRSATWTAPQAAERGIGCLGVSMGTPQEYEQRVKDYRRVVRKCEPVGEFVNDQVNGVTFLYVGETDEEASEWGTRLATTFAYYAAHLVGVSSVYPTPAYSTPGLLFSIRREAQEQARGGGGVIREGMAIGSPQTVIKNLKMGG